MRESNVLGFAESIPMMTIEKGIAFIDRTRRQLDRFEVLFPQTNGKRMPPEYESRIRAILDELEADIRSKQENI